MSLSLLRRMSDAFLEFVTPSRRRDHGGGVPDMFTGNMILLQREWLPLAEGGDIDEARRLGYWPGQEQRTDFVRAWEDGDAGGLERPWKYRWDRLPKRSAGPGFTRDEYHAARERGREVARATLGDDLWQQYKRDGYLDVASNRLPGITYRLRPGRRIQVIRGRGAKSPWYYDFLCINPAYPLPSEEFFAQVFLYLRDQEDEVIRVAAPQPWDQWLGRTF